MENLSAEDWRAAQRIWNYHQMNHEPDRCDVAIGLGSHDLGVATLAAELFHSGLFPIMVFTGATSPTTRERFPRGEAIHYSEHARELGVPDSAILVEPSATNTGDNIRFSRAVLEAAGYRPRTALLVSKPYMERRAFATCRKVWPELSVRCASESLGFDEYARSIGDARLVIDMLVGDLQRIIEYPKDGFAIEQPVPAEVAASYHYLIERGFRSRLLAARQ